MYSSLQNHYALRNARGRHGSRCREIAKSEGQSARDTQPAPLTAWTCCRASAHVPHSLFVVELAVLADEKEAFVRRDALGDVMLTPLLEVIGASRQGYVNAVRLLIDHDA